MWKAIFHRHHVEGRQLEGGESKASLFQKLKEQLNKVNSFYKDQVEVLKDEATHLKKQKGALIALRIKVKNSGSGLK